MMETSRITPAEIAAYLDPEGGISEWPWACYDSYPSSYDPDRINVSRFGSDKIAVLEAGKDISGRKVDWQFIASTPVALAILLVALVEEMARHKMAKWQPRTIPHTGSYRTATEDERLEMALEELEIPPARYERIKKRLEEVNDS